MSRIAEMKKSGSRKDGIRPEVSDRTSNISSARQSRHGSHPPGSSRKRSVSSASQNIIPALLYEGLMMSAKEQDMRETSDLVKCKYCNRKFFSHRIETHEAICKNISLAPRRKPFNSAAKRLAGTEAEPFAKNAKPVQRPLSNWKKNHEDLIEAIRAARRAHALMSKERKNYSDTSDLQMESSTSAPELIICPHCGRRFSEKTAGKHMEMCEKASLGTKRWK